MTQATTQTAPLGELYLHAYNPRQDHDDLDIKALAQSIEINGLMQNLSVIKGPDGLGVVAGGRRLRALQWLEGQNEGQEPANLINFDAIPIKVTDDPELALSWAGSEGATQLPLSPAEEIRAYSAMDQQGSTVDTIAIAFGQTTSHVKGRLKLAHLSEPVLDALRDKQISLDVAKAITLAHTPEQEQSALQLATQNDYNANFIRRHFAEGKISADDKLVKFIGLDLYRSEGGTLDEDLFSDQSVLHDKELVEQLHRDKLVLAAEKVKEDGGYQQAVPLFDANYGIWSHTDKMDRIYRVAVELPDGDATRLDELEELGAQREFTTEEESEYNDLEARQMGDYDDEQREAATVFVWVDHKGDLQTSEPYLPRNAKQTDTGSEATTVESKPAITNGGIDDLRKIQLLATQTKMLGQPEMMLDLLAFQLECDLSSFSGPINITPSTQSNLPSCTEGLTIDQRLVDHDEDSVTTDEDDINVSFQNFVAKGKKHRNAILTRLFVRCMNSPFASPINTALTDTLNITPRDVWTPTASNFFKACRSDYMDRIWHDLTQSDNASMERFTKLKVREKRTELEALFNDASVQEALGLSRDQIAAIDAWLPKQMQATT